MFELAIRLLRQIGRQESFGLTLGPVLVFELAIQVLRQIGGWDSLVPTLGVVLVFEPRRHAG